MDYSKLSDAEINLRIAKRFPDVYMINEENEPYHLTPDAMAAYSGSDYDEVLFDPCNSWADAGPIAQDSKISLHAPRFAEGWMAEHTGSDEDVNDGFYVDYFEHHDENPCRAICIVFLMMNEGE